VKEASESRSFARCIFCSFRDPVFPACGTQGRERICLTASRSSFPFKYSRIITENMQPAAWNCSTGNMLLVKSHLTRLGQLHTSQYGFCPTLHLGSDGDAARRHAHSTHPSWNLSPVPHVGTFRVVDIWTTIDNELEHQ
jgi:hypothetical protein